MTRRRWRDRAPRGAAFALAPVLVPQGRLTLRRVPRLPEAGGPDTGVVGPAGGEPIAILVAGESTAVGVGVDTHEEGMAVALAQRLHEQTDATVTWRVIGRNGARLRATPQRRLPPLAGEHDVVVLVLGVNDTLGLTSTARWRREVETLMSAARARLRPGGLLVLAGVPRLGTFSALPQPLRVVMGWHGDALDRVLDDIAARDDDVVHVPTPALESADDLADDGFHPSATGYRRWGARLHDEAVGPWFHARADGAPQERTDRLADAD